MEDVGLSGAHPMFERPIVVNGPYAAVKGKNGNKTFDTTPLEDEEGFRRAEYESLKARLETTYRQKIEEAQRMGREVSEHALAKMQQAYRLLQNRSEIDRLQITNESAAMKQCIQDLESQATLKNAVVESEASAYMDKQKLEAQAREAEQQQQVRTFEQRTRMEAIIQARGRDDELRSRFAAEVAENKLRADAEARRAIDIERNRVMFVDQLQMQDLQAKAAYYEALARQNQKNLDERNAQAAKELERISHHALAEREQYRARVDYDVKELRKSVQQTID